MRIISLIVIFFLISSQVSAKSLWVNDLRNLFISNKAVIYTLNIRTFNAQDLNEDDIIDPLMGESRGNFINAIDRLDEISNLGVNTIYLLPITKTGKLKALGTAGSLYAMDSFNEISPLLDDKKNPLSVYEEAKLFINSAHEKNLRVILDLPSCGSYDMSLERPDLFLKKNSQSVIPSDWTDVRLFKVYDEKGELNQDLISGYKEFIDMALDLGIDGVRADVAAIKPEGFWAEIINYARSKNPQFLFLAEASTSWDNPASPYTDYATVEELLRTGFDGYYGDWSNFKDIKYAKEFKKRVNIDKNISKKFKNNKTTLASFATHDQQSPMQLGANYWEMILWLNLTMPNNAYFLDGFPTGDSYNFKYENTKAEFSSTDDDYYFVHSGKFDIFNFSRRPDGKREDLLKIYKKAMKFASWADDILHKGKMNFHKTNARNVFAYSLDYGKDSVIVVGNLDSKEEHRVSVHIGGLNKKSFLSPIKIDNTPTIKRNRLITKLAPYEVQVYMFSKNSI